MKALLATTVAFLILSSHAVLAQGKGGGKSKEPAFLLVVDANGVTVGRLIQTDIAARQIDGEWVALDVREDQFPLLRTSYVVSYEADFCSGVALIGNEEGQSLPKVG